MPFLIPLFIGAGATGVVWYNSTKEEEKEPTFSEDLFAHLMPFFLLLLILLFFYWLSRKGQIKS